MAEARFLRAFYYYHALTYWGGVPLLKDEITSLDQVKNIKRATREELSNFIIDELTEVSDILEKSPAIVARASKGTALTLLAKMYLLQEQWENAAKTCEQIMGLNKYKLFDNYSDIFSQAFENQQEHIFSIQFNADYTDFSARMLWYLGPSKEEWDKFNGLGGSSAPTSFYDKYDEWDLRLEHNLAKTWRGQAFKDSRIAIIKYWDRTGKQMLDHDGLNFPVFRYADVLLMYAEALNEWKGAPTQEAYDAINEIRERAGVDEIEELDYKQFQSLIRDERARELHWEGQRRSDLVRFGKFTKDYAWAYKGGTLEGVANIDSRFNIYPISDRDLTANPNLVQNPGYESLK